MSDDGEHEDEVHDEDNGHVATINFALSALEQLHQLDNLRNLAMLGEQHEERYLNKEPYRCPI